MYAAHTHKDILHLAYNKMFVNELGVIYKYDEGLFGIVINLFSRIDSDSADTVNVFRDNYLGYSC